MRLRLNQWRTVKLNSMLLPSGYSRDLLLAKIRKLINIYCKHVDPYVPFFRHVYTKAALIIINITANIITSTIGTTVAAKETVVVAVGVAAVKFIANEYT